MLLPERRNEALITYIEAMPYRRRWRAALSTTCAPSMLPNRTLQARRDRRPASFTR
jgi:hypothetical protein